MHPSACKDLSQKFAQTGASFTLKRNPVVVIGVGRRGVGRDNSARRRLPVHSREVKFSEVRQESSENSSGIHRYLLSISWSG